jgi:hypothetical protein
LSSFDALAILSEVDHGLIFSASEINPGDDVAGWSFVYDDRVVAYRARFDLDLPDRGSLDLQRDARLQAAVQSTNNFGFGRNPFSRVKPL